MTDFLEFWRQQSEWSQATFGLDSEGGPIGPLKHLQKEVAEVLADPDDEMEYVDCLFLIVDAARRKGLTAERLLNLAFEKLEINKARKWGPSSADQPTEHVRETE